MGFFSNKKKVYVSSVVYNLLGDKQPTQYLPTTVFGGVLRKADSLGTVIKDGLLNGPGMRLRNFFKWVRNSGYADEVGLATSSYYPDVPINREELTKVIKQQNSNYLAVEVISASINYYDYTYIADQYVYNNRPDKLNDAYTVEEFAVVTGYSYETYRTQDDDGRWITKTRRVTHYRYDIRITFTDGTKVEINSSSYNKDSQYLYITYIYTYEEESWLGKPEIKQKTQYIVYCRNTGNAQFDSFFKEVVPLQRTYAPYIPIRTWNTFLSESYLPSTYKFAKRAFKKAVGSNNYNSLIADLKENKNIGDIDFAYIVLGVALNTPYKEGKQYIFTYLYNLWLNKQISDSISGDPEKIYGDKYKDKINNPKQINIKSNYGSINYNIWFEWGTMTHYYKTGQAKPGLKEGDYHFYAENEYYTDTDNDGDEVLRSIEHSYFCHQITPARYEVIELTNFTYANLIYKGKSVIYSALDALNGSDGPNETGFIIPLQEQSFKESGLVYTSQLAQSTYYCVFNCYVVKKVRWYQSGIFSFVLAIVIAVVVTVVTWNPAAGGATASAAAGTGTAAAGAVATTATASLASAIMINVVNAVAGMIVLNVLTDVAKEIFGDKLGSIIGTVVSMVVMNFASGISNGLSVSEALTQLSSASQMMKLANAVISGIKDAINTDTQEIYNKSQIMFTEYEQRMEDISKLQAELFNQTLDITSITDALKSYSYEPRDSYLSRTLMTGSDIAEMTMDLIHNFTNYSMNTELTI